MKLLGFLLAAQLFSFSVFASPFPSLFGKWEGEIWSVDYRGNKEALFCQFEIVDRGSAIEFVSLNGTTCHPANVAFNSQTIEKSGSDILFKGNKVGVISDHKLLYNSHYFSSDQRIEFFENLHLNSIVGGMNFDYSSIMIVDASYQLMDSARGHFTKMP